MRSRVGVRDDGVDLLRRVALVSARINSGSALQDTLQAVADGVVEALGFGAAVVNFRLPNGDFEVLAITGPPGVRDALAGQVTPAAVMHRILDGSIHWGALRYTPHDVDRPGEPAGWRPDVEVPDAVDAWHPDELLLAPLHSATGVLVGILSVDLPPGQLRPGPLLLELLEIFAVQAGIAIDNARLASRLHAEQEELRREQARLRASEAAFRFSFTESASAMVMVSLEPAELGRVLRVNRAICGLLDYPAGELEGSDLVDVLARDSSTATREVLARFASGELTDRRIERRVARSDGTRLWVELTETAVRPGPDQPSFLLIRVDDITERRSREGRLAYQAEHDALTGLPNRRLLFERLEAGIDHARRTGRPGALFFCDIDGFKELNDRFGHAAGDQVLAEMAERLLDGVRSRDTVARLGGDEFVIIAEDLDQADVPSFVQRLRDAVSEPLAAVDGRLGLSIGSAPIGAGQAEAAADPAATHLLTIADAAMYADKLARSGATTEAVPLS
jgi:diguanylate cyclase (GGDEF)-like protein/PAS domain S-box-containing protein